MADVSASMLKDLSLSGLTPEDIFCRPLDAPERAATNLPAMVEGYVIPYFDIAGRRLGFYRVKTFDHEPRYKQPKNTGNYIYFPPHFLPTVNGHSYVLLTEGEKKAASATKAGFPCVGLGGTDSWRTRTLAIPKGTELIPGGDGVILAKLDETTWRDGDYAKGFEE